MSRRTQFFVNIHEGVGGPRIGFSIQFSKLVNDPRASQADRKLSLMCLKKVIQ